MVRTAVASLLLLAVVGCGDYSVAFRNREPFRPLPVYADWWRATESCSGRSGDLLAIRWYTAESIESNELIASGLWSPPHEIVLVRGYEEDEFTVRHEMLHDLLRGDATHSAGAWRACALAPEDRD